MGGWSGRKQAEVVGDEGRRAVVVEADGVVERMAAILVEVATAMQLSAVIGPAITTTTTMAQPRN